MPLHPASGYPRSLPFETNLTAGRAPRMGLRGNEWGIGGGELRCHSICFDQTTASKETDRFMTTWGTLARE